MKLASDQQTTQNINQHLTGVVSIGDGYYSKLNTRSSRVFGISVGIAVFLFVVWAVNILLWVGLSFLYEAHIGLFYGGMGVLCGVLSLTIVYTVKLLKSDSKRKQIEEIEDFQANVKIVIKRLGIDVITIDEEYYIEEFEWKDFESVDIQKTEATSEFLFGMSIKSKTAKSSNRILTLHLKNGQRLLFYVDTGKEYKIIADAINANKGITEEVHFDTDELDDSTKPLVEQEVMQAAE